MKRKQFVNYLLWFIILCWAGIATVFWVLSPRISTFTNASYYSSVNQIIKGTGSIGLDLMIILLGYFGGQKNNTEALVITGWSLTWFVSVIAFITSALCCQVYNRGTFTPTIFNSLFPLIRNTYPLIFGPLLGLILNQVTAQLNRRYQIEVLYGIWILIALALFTTPNMWGWEDKTLTVFYSLLTLLGARFYEYDSWTTKRWIKVTIGAWLLSLIFDFLVPFMTTSPQNVSRFSLPSSVFIVITAYGIFRLLCHYLASINALFIFTYLTLIQNTALMALLSANIVPKTNSVTAITGIWAIGIVISLLIISLLCNMIWHQKPFVTINERINDFCKLNTSTQIVTLKSFIKSSLPNLGIIAVSYCVSAISILSMNIGRGDPFPALKAVFSQRESNIFFAALFCFASIKFLQAITKRYWFSNITIIAINGVIAVANKLKMSARNEPILPVDLHLINVAGQIVKMVNIKVWIAALFTLVVLVLLIIALEMKEPVKYHSSKAMRIWFIIFAPLLFLSSTVWNRTNYLAANFLSFINDEPTFENQMAGATLNGPIVQFLNNVDISVMNKPSGYSKKNMLQIRQRYEKTAKQINKHRTNKLSNQSLVFVLSESFSNPSHVPGVKLKNNPIPYITKLKKDNTGGLMISSGYGGGTANMEYMALTGFAMCNFSPTMSTPYSQLVPSLKKHPSIIDSFNYAVCIHPYIGTFYNRISVYRNFGVNKYFYLGNSKAPIKHKHYLDKSPYLSDQTAYDNVLDQLKDHKNGEFINMMTMQNHMPYDASYYKTKPDFNPISVPKGTNIIPLKDYISGINYTDNETKEFINQINQINKPVTVVFYGDHLPGDIYSNDMTKDGLQKHETDYFIYSNKYARQHGARNLAKSTAFVSPTDFIAMAAKQTNSKVNWYQAMLTDIYEDVPAFARGFKSNQHSSANTNTQFVSRDGHLMQYSQMTKKQKQIYHDYQLVQYDITAGHHYLTNSMK